ncbi:MAG: hypothetical protein K6E10_12230 [Eubacterium sp.]|nr:hypothetical protein [Eubacterium sp.]
MLQNIPDNSKKSGYGRRRLAILLALFLVTILFNIPTLNVHAEDVSIILALWPTEVNIGETVTATITINGDVLGDYNISLEYPADLLEYQSNPDANGSILISGSGPNTLTYNFKAKAEGVAHIVTSGYQLYDSNGYQLSVEHAGGNITIGQVQEDDGKINIGGEAYTLVNEYQLPKAPDGFELSYVNYNDKDIYAYKAPNNSIKVVCLQNSEYEAKWFVYDEEKEEFSPFLLYDMEGISYTLINIPDDVEIPEGFTEGNLSIQGSQFKAYTDGSNSGLYLIYAINSVGNTGLYFYDTDEGSLIRYDAVDAMVKSVSEMNKEEDTDSFDDVSEDASFSDAAEESGADSEAVDDNKEDKEGSQPLIVDEITEEKNPEDEFLTNNRLKSMLKTMMVIFVIMCVIIIILIIRNGYLASRIDNDDFDEDDEEENDIISASVSDEEDAAQKAAEAMAKEKTKKSKNTKYDRNDDTGEILLEEAEDNNSGVNVPPAEDVEKSKIEEAKKLRPYGMDSAFDVVSADEAPEGDHVYIEPEPNMEGLIDPALYEKDITPLTQDMLDDNSEQDGANNDFEQVREDLNTEKLSRENPSEQVTLNNDSEDQEPKDNSMSLEVKEGSVDNYADDSNKKSESKSDNINENAGRNKKKRRNKKGKSSDNSAKPVKKTDKVVLPGQGNEEDY